MTNIPLHELLGIPGCVEPTREPISPTNGQSKVVVRIADSEGRNWHVAFPGLVEEDAEDSEPEYRS